MSEKKKKPTELRTFEVIRETQIASKDSWRVTFEKTTVDGESEWTMHMPNAATFTEQQLTDALTKLKELNSP